MPEVQILVTVHLNNVEGELSPEDKELIRAGVEGGARANLPGAVPPEYGLSGNDIDGVIQEG